MIKHIFHLSDIHIRNGDVNYSRFYEYKSVFENLFISINNNITNLNLKKNEYLIIITGDIFHNKNNIGNYGLMLYKILIENLTKIALTIIFEGNHDSIQHELNQPSLVTSTIKINNLIVLNESKSFIIDNIGFSYVNIRDTLDNFSNSGRKNILKPFPIIDKPVSYKIALFHGTFANVKLYNGNNITSNLNPYPFEWIQDFDYALLGDIHLRQKNFFKNKLLWCYSGSLIQQNFGEDIIEHGYVLWNLEEKNIFEYNILNNNGKIILKQVDNLILFKKNNKFIELDNFIYKNINFFPKNLEIKFITDFDYNILKNIMDKYNIKFNIINNTKSNKNLFNNLLDNYNEFNKDNIITYFKNHLEIKQYNILLDILKNYDKLLFNLDDYPIDLKDECLKKNKELSIFINNCRISEDNIFYNNKFFIKYIEWNNLFCYTSNNFINFENLSNSTFLISGKNGIGKSAIYDIITLSIWGEITKNKQNEITSGIINYNSDNASSIVEIYNSENKLFKIKRFYTRNKDNHLLLKIKTELYEFINNKYILLKKDTASKDYIHKLFGNIETFLSSSMITQNIDYDIIKMNYKDTTQIIDKVTNIKYIYDLYNLFKNVLNKYKDFNKIIISKKNVYKTLINNFNNDYHNLYLTNINNELNLLNYEKNKLKNKFDNLSINIDKNIVFINYDILINKLDNINIKSDLEYDIAIDKFNELKFFFKNNNISDDEIKSLSLKYDNSLIINLEIQIDKPCDLSFLQNLKNQFNQYNNFDNIYQNDTLENLQNKLNNLNIILNDLDIEINNLNNIKPPYYDKPLFDYNNIIQKIIYLFNSEKNFINYYNNNNKLKLNDSIDLIDNITHLSIIKNIKKQKNISNNIQKIISKINIIDTNIKNDMNLLNNDNIILKPNTNIKFKNSISIKKYIQNNFNNIDNIIKYNNDNIEFINDYNNKLNDIKNIEDSISIFKNELEIFNNNDEYKYDPNCIYCSKRPWIIKINELKNKIKDSENNIINIYNYINNNFININSILKTYNNNLIIIDKYNLYNKWLDYYLYFENKNKFNINIKTSEHLKTLLNNYNLELNNLKNINDNFLNLCYNLYSKYTEYNNYLKYNEWFNKFNLINIKYNDITNQINHLKEHINYIKNIKPKIDYFNAINNKYNIWENYFNNLLIFNAYTFINLENDINKYKLYNEYITNKNKQSYMLEKININNEINNLDNNINNLKSNITIYTTTKNINDSNVNSYNKLNYIENNNIVIIDIITIIIDKFKDYRKWLYNTYILKNIIYNTNYFIKLLCHNDTKLFELDYLLTDNKDIIHINWLIKNVDNFNNLQTISINQASGFQRFVISIALRLSLFNNKHCNQLFIDEGFTTCDKNNLSIVPYFFKNLLKIFNTIIIVSHIDLIQDSIDEKIEIIYNSNDKSSNIKYF